MKIIRNIKHLNHKLKHDFKQDQLPPLVLTIGSFDGLHLGHIEVLSLVKEISKQQQIASALVTFEPHPLNILNPSAKRDFRLTSLATKLKIIKEQEIDYVVVLPFNLALAAYSADDFVTKILLDGLNMRHLVIGHDFIFGKNRQGDIGFLQKKSLECNFGLSRIDAFKIFANDSNHICSSSRIRSLITEGNIEVANKILGRNFAISGMVVNGNKLASTIGFPTANILSKLDIIKPKFGVYKALVTIANTKLQFKAILNYGIRPTIASENKAPIYEIHLFDYDQQIYGSLYQKKLQVELLKFVREEKKFASIEELKNQIKKDCQNVIND